MNHKRITKLQKEINFYHMQELINNGQCWIMEGEIGREAMHLLTIGACMLPKKAFFDYYGNRIPSRDELKEGTKGTYKNSVKFWAENQYSILNY